MKKKIDLKSAFDAITIKDVTIAYAPQTQDGFTITTGGSQVGIMGGADGDVKVNGCVKINRKGDVLTISTSLFSR